MYIDYYYVHWYILSKVNNYSTINSVIILEEADIYFFKILGSFIASLPRSTRCRNTFWTKFLSISSTFVMAIFTWPATRGAFSLLSCNGRIYCFLLLWLHFCKIMSLHLCIEQFGILSLRNILIIFHILVLKEKYNTAIYSFWDKRK